MTTLPGPWTTTAPDGAPRPRLLDRVRDAVRARHYSIRTEEAYIGWIRRYIRFHSKRHPDEMGEPEINAFLTYLAVAQRVGAATQNQALAALLFLYRRVLGKEMAAPGPSCAPNARRACPPCSRAPRSERFSPAWTAHRSSSRSFSMAAGCACSSA
jgi:hypothetical protein